MGNSSKAQNNFNQNEEIEILSAETKIKETALEVIRLAEKLVQVKGELFFSRTEFDLGKGRWSSTCLLYTSDAADE